MNPSYTMKTINVQPNTQPSVVIYQPPPITPISQFDGTSDVLDFIDEFDSLASSSDWNDYQQTRYIQSYLSGDVKISFNLLPDIDKRDITRIKSFLLREYGYNRDHYLQQFHNRRPKLNEKPKSYALAIQRLLKRAMPTLQKDEYEQFLKQKLLSYLPKSYQATIRLLGNRDWDSLIKDVSLLVDSFGQAELNDDQILSTSVNTMTVPVNYNNNSNNTYRSNNQNNQNRYRNFETKEHHNNKDQYSNLSTMKCFNCGTYGHLSRNCYRKTHYGNDNYNYKRQNENYQHDMHHYRRDDSRNRRNDHHNGHNNTQNRRNDINHNRNYRTRSRSRSGNRSVSFSRNLSVIDHNERDNQLNNMSSNDLKLFEIFKDVHKVYHEQLTAQNDRKESQMSNLHSNDEVRPSTSQVSKMSCNTFDIEQDISNSLRLTTVLCINQFDKVEASALVDTGASHSFINMNILSNGIISKIKSFINDKNKKNDLNLMLKQVTIQSATEAVQTTCVQMNIDLIINNEYLNHDFIITDLINKEQAIFGLDFIRKYKMNINGEDNTISIKSKNDDYVQLPVCQVRRTVVIPANTEMLLNVTVSGSITANKIHLFESFDHHKQGLLFTKSIDSVNTVDDQKLVRVMAYNYGNHDVKLKMGQRIGRLYNVDLLEDQLDDSVDVLASDTSNKCECESTSLNETSNNEELIIDSFPFQIGKYLSTDERNEIARFLYKYQSLFSKSQYDLR